MKKILIGMAGILSLVFINTGCQSTKNNQTEVDNSELTEITQNEDDDDLVDEEDNDEVYDEETSEDDYEEDSEGISDEERAFYKKEKEKKSGFNLANIFSSSFKAYSYGESSVFIKNMLGSIKQHKTDICYFPKTETYGWGSTYLAAYYYAHFDEEQIQKLQKARQQYISDFENKKLSRNDKNSYKKYGKSLANINFGTIKSSTPNNGEALCYFGYKFIDNSPWFTITINSTYNKYHDVDSNASTDTLNLTYYFNKAELTELCKCLEKKSIDAVTRQYNQETYGVYTEKDEY